MAGETGELGMELMWIFGGMVPVSDEKDDALVPRRKEASLKGSRSTGVTGVLVPETSPRSGELELTERRGGRSGGSKEGEGAGFGVMRARGTVVVSEGR